MTDTILEKLKPNTVIKGNLFPEQVHVIVAMPFGNAIKLVGRGDSNQVYDLVIPEDKYAEIEFVEPGSVVYDISAQYNLGWFYKEDGELDLNKHPRDFKPLPLQQTASDILGLEYTEIRPILNLPKVEKKKKVGIGFHSTAQSKYWNNKQGWQQVVDYLNNLVTPKAYCLFYKKR
jgi:hypothetical protein